MAIVTQRILKPGERIRVMVVDDSVVIRSLITEALEQEPLLHVVGSASNGLIALQRIPQLNPDVITLDIEMPEMDGLETLRRIRKEFPTKRVVMFSTLTERGVAITLEALSLGADDYATKVSNEGSLDRSIDRMRSELIPKIKQFFQIPVPPGASPDVSPGTGQNNINPASPLGNAGVRSASSSPPLKVRPKAVLIGVSTGGPSALNAILPSLPPHFSLPVLIVQHMPSLFTRLLSERLHASCRLPVTEAVQGEVVEGGKVLIAPGDFHMKVTAAGELVRICLDQSPTQNSCRPAVDALFASAAAVYGGAVVAIMLTGMGQDGLRGTEALKSRGAYVLAQDKETSVVWGMPGAVAGAGLADRILPLDQVIPEVLRATGQL